jgi:hypothetical protein
MATRLQKILWSALCGTALGLSGCYDSDDGDMYGPPPDVETDGDEDASDASDAIEDMISENVAMYGPAPMYGPEP